MIKSNKDKKSIPKVFVDWKQRDRINTPWGIDLALQAFNSSIILLLHNCPQRTLHHCYPHLLLLFVNKVRIPPRQNFFARLQGMALNNEREGKGGVVGPKEEYVFCQDFRHHLGTGRVNTFSHGYYLEPMGSV